MQKITIATLKNGLSLNFTLPNIESAAIPTNKTIAPTQKLYQSGHAIWWYTAPAIIRTFLEAYDFSGKVVVPFATSGGSGLGKTAETLQEVVPTATVKDGRVLNGKIHAEELKKWADNFEK